MISSQCNAWDSTGHGIIAYIAYQNLTRQARHSVNNMTKNLSKSDSADQRFIYASIWPDLLRVWGIDTYNHWHFINIPLVKDNITSPPLNADNVVWAINHCLSELRSGHLSKAKTTFYMSFLMHTIDDANQPMHCISFYSKEFPRGDKGGNAYPINNPDAHTLHRLWDKGVNLWTTKNHHEHYAQIKEIATEVMHTYPPAYFKTQLADHNIQDWVHQGHLIAVEHAYTLPINGTPSAAYIKTGQTLSKKQLALAGYRVADAFNQLFSKTK